MSFVCPRCCDREVEPADGATVGEYWLRCPAGCGRWRETDLADYYEMCAEQALSREIAECWREQEARPHASGGSDDGMAVTLDIPIADDSLVAARPRESKSVVVRVRNLAATSHEVRESLAEWFLRPDRFQ